MAGSAAASDDLEQERAAAFVASFAEVCLQQVETLEMVSPEGWYWATEVETAELARAIGLGRIPEGIVMPQSGAWMKIDVSLSAPETCQFFMHKGNFEAMAEAWNAWIGSDGATFRANALAAVEIGEDRQRLKGWASEPVEGGFVQVSMNGLALEGVYFLSLLAARVGQSEASCNLWPEVCE